MAPVRHRAQGCVSARPVAALETFSNWRRRRRRSCSIARGIVVLVTGVVVALVLPARGGKGSAPIPPTVTSATSRIGTLKTPSREQQIVAAAVTATTSTGSFYVVGTGSIGHADQRAGVLGRPSTPDRQTVSL
jgi:glycerol uptake facilitator-like aquaporin